MEYAGGMKTCANCRQPLPESSFYRHPQTYDKLFSVCKTCHKSKMTANRNANLQKYREKDRQRAKHPERIRALTANTKRWRQEDKRRAKCHNAVARAILNGRLIRKPCRICNSAETHAHHHDYDKPYDVDWLCAPCHSAEHKKQSAKK
jgi:hypothetical protein